MNAITCMSGIGATALADAEPATNRTGPAALVPDGRSAAFGAARAQQFVYVVDDNRDSCREIVATLAQVGHVARVFEDGTRFLDHLRADVVSCLLVDAGPNGVQGLQLLRHLASMPTRPAVVLMQSGGGDVATAVNAMKAGAIDVLPKPLVRQDLLCAVATALDEARRRRASHDGARATLQRAATLTIRERQVMTLVTSGLMNKQVASALSVSEIAVKIYRGNLMKKLGIRTLPGPGARGGLAQPACLSRARRCLEAQLLLEALF